MKTLLCVLIVLALVVPVVASADYRVTYIEAPTLDRLERNVQRANASGACIDPFLYPVPISQVARDVHRTDKQVLVQPMLCDPALMPDRGPSD